MSHFTRMRRHRGDKRDHGAVSKRDQRADDDKEADETWQRIDSPR